MTAVAELRVIADWETQRGTERSTFDIADLMLNDFRGERGSNKGSTRQGNAAAGRAAANSMILVGDNVMEATS